MAVRRLTYHHPAPGARVRALVTGCRALARVGECVLRMEGPHEASRIRAGQMGRVGVRPDRLPPQPDEIPVEPCDDAQMRFQSHERGAGARPRHHVLSLSPEPGGTRLTDEIDIDAGPLTPLFRLWARLPYRRRHKPRLALLQSGDF